jgi:hypothetical protein
MVDDILIGREDVQGRLRTRSHDVLWRGHLVGGLSSGVGESMRRGWNRIEIRHNL